MEWKIIETGYGPFAVLAEFDEQDKVLYDIYCDKCYAIKEFARFETMKQAQRYIETRKQKEVEKHEQ